jgi:hypothetical protein
MPPLAWVCGAGPELPCQIGTVHFKGLADHLLELAGWTRQVERGKSKEIMKGRVVAGAGSDACLEVRFGRGTGRPEGCARLLAAQRRTFP